MSCTVTQTFSDLEQVSLVNIITLSELKLQKNFQVILKHLEGTNSRIAKLEERLSEHESTTKLGFADLNEHLSNSANTSSQLRNMVIQHHSELEALKSSSEHSLAFFDQKFDTLKSDLGEKMSQLTNETLKLKEQIQTLQNDDKKILDIINLKAEKTEYELEKTKKQINSLIIKAEMAAKKGKSIEQKIERIETSLQDNPALNPDKLATHIKKINEEMLKELTLEDPAKYPRLLGEHKKPPTPAMSENGVGGDSAILLKELRNKIQVLESLNSRHEKALEKLNIENNEFRSFKTEVRNAQNKQKHESSSNYLLEKIQELRPELNKMASRIDSVQDKASVAERKQQQARKILNEVHLHIKENNMAKYDEKIRNLQTEIFGQIKDINAKLETKTNLSDFYRVCQLHDQKFKEIADQLSTKCEKVEVKKALLFIESKLKEIILVIAQDQENEKDALLTKKNIKCISCDKELDKYAGLVSGEARNWNSLPTKELQVQHLGKFGITKFGSLAKKLKKLESGELPLLRSKKQNASDSIG